MKHPINKNPISLTSEIVCSYMRVFNVITDTAMTLFSIPAIFARSLGNDVTWFLREQTIYNAE